MIRIHQFTGAVTRFYSLRVFTTNVIPQSRIIVALEILECYHTRKSSKSHLNPVKSCYSLGRFITKR
jgi:hypothetical protein